MATGQASSIPVPAMRPYLPVEHAVVVIGPQYLAQYPVELTFDTCGGGGENDFKVVDINGIVIFQVKSKFLTLHGRRFIKDAAGNTLVNIKQKRRTMHGKWEAFRVESKEEKDLLFTVKRSKLDVFLANNKGEIPDFKVKGGSILLGDTNTMLAQMHRKLKSNSQCGLFLEVYPNVDYTFIVALVVTLNADRSEEGGSILDLVPVAANTIASTIATSIISQ